MQQNQQKSGFAPLFFENIAVQKIFIGREPLTAKDIRT